MARKNRNIGAEILRGIRELKRGEHSRVINVPKVATIRERTGLSQSRFAQLLGVSMRTLQDWEQGRRAPSGAARTPPRHRRQKTRKLCSKLPETLLWSIAAFGRCIPPDIALPSSSPQR